MADVIHELYEKHVYPPMSHPLSDPAISAVAARIGGLEVRHPRAARVLEIGCSSGHNLLPLALRWPGSEFVGIDLAERSIDEARDRAARAGILNVTFHSVDLRDFVPDGGPFDFIIAHGFLSWVPDDVKAALFHFCRQYLALSGIATVSFNLEAGWKSRRPVIAKVRAILQAGGGDEMSALAILKSFADPADPEVAIIDDMLAKGPAILAFDDFAPINDPWPFNHFASTAAGAGLRYLGESDPGENIPADIGYELLEELKTRTRDPLAFQLAVDEAAGRTFRSGVLCRSDARVTDWMSLATLFDLSVGGAESPDSHGEEIGDAIRSFTPACVPLEELAARLPDLDRKTLATRVFEGITRGWVRPRIEPVRYDPHPPEFPALDRFRLLCARDGLPLVDAWHKPCAFPPTHYQVLAAMDGSRTRAELAAFSKTHCPDLAFEPWLRHLAWRGMFA
jgi:SAM-dependent methyltransferase